MENISACCELSCGAFAGHQASFNMVAQRSILYVRATTLNVHTDSKALRHTLYTCFLFLASISLLLFRAFFF